MTSDTVGVIGFCMGGMLAMVIGAQQGDKIGGVATFYGAPLGDAAPDWSGLTAPVLGHFAMNDDFFPPDAVRELEQQLREMGKDVSFEYIPDTGHAFVNEDNPFGDPQPRRRAEDVDPQRRVAAPGRWAEPGRSAEAERGEHRRGHLVATGRQQLRPLDVDGVARSRSGHASHGPGGIEPSTQ